MRRSPERGENCRGRRAGERNGAHALGTPLPDASRVQVDSCLCGLLFYAFGFAFMFGGGTPLIGTQCFFLQDVPATYGSTGVAFPAFWLFPFAFADTCSTIT